MNNQRVARVVDVVSFVFVIISILIMPIFLDRSLANFYIIPKQYVLGVSALILLFLTILKAVVAKRISYKKSVLDKTLLLFLGLGLVSSIFSVNIYDSFWGRGEFFVFNFLFLFFSALYYFLIINQVDTRARWRLSLNSLVLVGGVTALIFIIRSLFHPGWFNFIFGANSWNTVDPSNGVFGLWLVIIFILAAGQLIKKDLPVGNSVFNFSVALLSLLAVLFLGFSFLWWMMLGGLVLLLLLGVSFIKESRTWWLSVLFAVLVMCAIFIIFGPPKFLQSAVPVEVSLGISPSWGVTTKTTLSSVKSFLFGTGLGTFNFGFSRFRTIDFNFDQTAWALRFSQPFNSFFALVSEGGALFSLLFVFLCLFVLGYVFLVWYRSRSQEMLRGLEIDLTWSKNDIRMETFLVIIAWVILSVGAFCLFLGPVMWWMWWLLLALGISGLSFFSANIISNKEFKIEDAPEHSLSFSFLMIVLAAAIIMVVVLGVKLYSAERLYSLARNSTDAAVAEKYLLQAVSRREKSDVYHASLAQVYLAQASDLSRSTKPDVQTINKLMAQAVNEAKLATDISPNSVAIWENLATMYENAALIVAEARDWAIKSLLKAKELEPTNPVLAWRLGNNYSMLGKWEDAAKNYQEAIDLKSDYFKAYVSLATVYEQTQQTDKAIDLYKNIIPQASKDTDVLFNLGRLLYNRNSGKDRVGAEELWLRVVELEPKYSNALYSLGLLYESKGNKTTALQYYYKVKELNPNNKDVVAKIKSLLGVPTN